MSTEYFPEQPLSFEQVQTSLPEGFTFHEDTQEGFTDKRRGRLTCGGVPLWVVPVAESVMFARYGAHEVEPLLERLASHTGS